MPMPEENSVPEDVTEPHDYDRENVCADIEAYIIAKPFKALAIALLAGIAVGKLIL
jgi:hypothetical protein